MARHRAAKAREKIVSTHGPPRGQVKAGSANSGLKKRLAASERERDTLRADVERLRARVRALEKTQAHVRDRISWAADSLRSIIEAKN